MVDRYFKTNHRLASLTYQPVVPALLPVGRQSPHYLGPLEFAKYIAKLIAFLFACVHRSDGSDTRDDAN